MKKFLLLLLALAMFASPGWAADVYIDKNTIDKLQSAEGTLPGSINSGDVFIFSEDIKLKQTLTINRNIKLTINGNGHKLTGSGNGSVIKITNGDVNLNDLTITSGDAQNYGGGVYVQSGTLSVTNCVFDHNTANYSGGGMYVGEGAKAFIRQCTFINNTASGKFGTPTYDMGGGLRVQAGGVAEVTNCTFTRNTANKGGGGLYVDGPNGQISGGEATINYCTFVNNVGEHGSELYKANGATLTVSNSILYNTGTDLAYDIELTNSLVKPSGWTPKEETAPSKTGNVTHTVFKIDGLTAAIDKGTETITLDQLGTNRDSKPDIGAVEIATAATVATPTFSPAGGTYTT
ncbi:MAG: hypothetical protein IJR68_04545, partial [Fretibacterium sp.]|nr:hypothetical protein [Fretibacterium sp.]